MIDATTIWLKDAKKAASAGNSLARTLYTFPVNVLLSGELGAGKTTFLQGFAEGLGVKQRIASPTYALEQRYRTGKGIPFIHIDLYRLSAPEAAPLLHASEEHPGIRAIEWADRAPEISEGVASIHIHLEEKDEGRSCMVSFQDVLLPSHDQVLQWRAEVRLPKHIVRHCDAVADFSGKLADELLARGILLRPLALQRAAELHDLLRFIDFRPGGSPKDSEPDSEEDLRMFEAWKERFAGLHHEEACAAFLREQGYSALADIIAVHGLHLPSPDRSTIEQKILFYADKRVRIDEVVTLDERFADFEKRYGKRSDSAAWYKEAKNVEEELCKKPT